MMWEETGPILITRDPPQIPLSLNSCVLYSTIMPLFVSVVDLFPYMLMNALPSHKLTLFILPIIYLSHYTADFRRCGNTVPLKSPPKYRQAGKEYE